MRTIRLQGMSDADYKAVSLMRCPECNSDGNARTNYSASVDGRIGIDITCDSCGASWTSYDKTAEVPRVDQLKIPAPEHAPVEIEPPTPYSITANNLDAITDNQLRRMKKSELLAMAIDLDIEGCTSMKKTELADVLISFRENHIQEYLDAVGYSEDGAKE